MRIAAHDAKPLIRSLFGLDLDMTGLVLDTKLAAYLLDPSDLVYGLDELVRRHTRFELAEDAVVPEGQLDFGETSWAPPTSRPARRWRWRTWSSCSEALAAQGPSRLNDEVEVPLVRVLAHGAPRGRGRRRGAAS